MEMPSAEDFAALKALEATDAAGAATKYEAILASLAGSGANQWNPLEGHSLDATLNLIQLLPSLPAADEKIKIQETVTAQLGGLYKTLKRPDDLANLISTSYAFFASLTKAKSAKLGELIPT
jgi:hypothetical protein